MFNFHFLLGKFEKPCLLILGKQVVKIDLRSPSLICSGAFLYNLALCNFHFRFRRVAVLVRPGIFAWIVVVAAAQIQFDFGPVVARGLYVGVEALCGWHGFYFWPGVSRAVWAILLTN